MPSSPQSQSPLADSRHQALDTSNQAIQHGSHSDSQDVSPAENRTLPKTVMDLPAEVLLHAISHLDPRDIATSERVCKSWFDTCRDDACWRTAFFARFEAATAPGRRLTGTSSTWKAEYLFRSKMLRMWAKSSAKSRVADLKLSHITNLELLPQGGALVASTWSGRGQTLSPATLKASKFSLLPDNNLVDEVISCVSNPDYIFWATHSQICAIALSFKSSTRVLDQSMGSIAALATVQGADQHTLVAVAFLSGHLAIYDALACVKIWQTSEEQRLMDGDQVPLTVKAVVANGQHIVAATEHSMHFLVHGLHPTTATPWRIQLEGRLNYIALDRAHVLVHELGEAFIRRYVDGKPIKRYISITSCQAITAITYDFGFPSIKTGSSTVDFGRQKYMAAGRVDGTVDAWLWDAGADEEVERVQSVRTFHPAFKHGEMRVTALACSDILLFAGYLDGSIRAFDLLSGQLVRVFNEQSTPRHALRQVLQGMADDRRWMVSTIVANDRTVYATLGERFWTWTCTEAVLTKKKKRRGPRMSNRAERYQEGADLESDLLEYEAESSPRQPTTRRPQFSLESLLSPDEAIQYAQLLSVEAEEERRTRLAEQSVEMDFDLEELLALDEMEAELNASPVISDQDYEDYLGDQTSFSFGTSAASPQTISASRSPHLSPQLHPHDSNSFRRLSHSALSASLDDQSQFPTLAATSPSRAPGLSQSPTPSTPASRGGWSAVLRRPSASPMSSSSMASRDSPLPNVPSTASSGVDASADVDDVDDPDLKLAIQLSLLEAREGDS